MHRRIALALLPALLAGCSAVSGFPKPIIDERAEDAELAPYVGAQAMANYDSCVDKLACRNTLIDARLRAVDLAFYRFQRRIYGQESRISLGSDLAATALSSIASVTGTRPLAAGAGLLTGGRDEYKKQVLSVSLPLLFDEMVARRRELLVRIRQGEQTPVAGYTLFQALADISEYEQAGSIPAAAAELGASAGRVSINAQAQLDALRARAQTAAVALASMPAAAEAAVQAVPAVVTGVVALPSATPPPPAAATTTTTVQAPAGAQVTTTVAPPPAATPAPAPTSRPPPP